MTEPSPKFRHALIVILLGLFFMPPSEASEPSENEPADTKLLLRHVDLITLSDAGVLADRDVLIQNDMIVAIEAGGHFEPADASRVIDGRGRYLLPGLIDAHVHLRKEDQLLNALAWGVTSLRSMEGSPELLAWRDEIASGQRLGPTVVSASPILHRLADGNSRFIRVTTEDGARARLRTYHEAGYDLIKVAELDDGPFFALMEEARSVGVTVAGHTPNEDLDLSRVLAEGMASHEHLQELWEVHQKQVETASPTTFTTLFAKNRAVITPILSADAVNNQLFAERRAYLTPERTVAIREAGGEDAIARVENAIAAIEKGDWQRQPVELDKTFAVLRALHDAGVTLIAGTDSGGALVPIGPGLHRELAFYARAGLPSDAILRTATVDAARVLGLDDRGQIVVGKRADLLLVRGNPLDDLGHLRDIVGVVVAGRWLADDELVPRVPAPADIGS